MPADIEINIPSPSPEVLQGLQQALGGMGTEEEAVAPAPISPAPAAPAVPAPPPDVLRGLQNSLDAASRSAGSQLPGEEGPSPLDVVSDVGKSLASGAVKAVDETIDFGQSLVSFGTDIYREGWDASRWREPTADEKLITWQPFRTLADYKPETGLGDGVQGVSQFLVGMVGAGKLLKPVRMLKTVGGGGAAGTVAYGLGAGAASDFLAFDAADKNILGLLDAVPGLRGPVLAYFNHDEDEAVGEGRLKNAVAGMVGGVAVEGIMAGLRAAKRFYRSRTGEEAEQALADAADDIEKRTGANDPVFEETAPREAVWDGSSPPDTRPASHVSDPDTPFTADGPLEEQDLLGGGAVLDMIRKSANETEAVTDILYNTNLRRIAFTSPQTSHLLADISEALADKTLKKAGVEHHDDVFSEAMNDLRRTGVNFERLLSKTLANSADMHRINREALQARSAYNFMLTDMERLAQRILDDTATAMEKAEFKALHVNVQQMQKALADLRTETGRATSLWKKVTDDRALEPFTFRNEVGAREYLENMHAMDDELKNLATALTTHQGDRVAQIRALTESPSLWSLITERARNLFIHNILTGYVTHGVNIAGNALNMLDIPLSRMIGGAARGNRQQTALGYNMFRHMLADIPDAWRMSRMAFGQRHGILEAGRGTQFMDGRDAIDGMMPLRNWFRDKNTARGIEDGTLSRGQERWARADEFFRKHFFWGNSFMSAEDEFFRQWAYRLDLRARLMDEAVARGLSGDAFDAYVRKGVENAVDAEGRAVIDELVPPNIREEYDRVLEEFKKLPRGSEGREAARRRLDELRAEVDSNAENALKQNELRKQALETARRVTFTQDPGEATKALIHAADRIPGGRYVMPFIRTPVNIVKDFLEHVPLTTMRTKAFEALEQQMPGRGAEALGRQIMGASVILGLWASGFLYDAEREAADGRRLTAAPPEGKREREKWFAVGNQPYSIRVGDTWVAYNRMGPLGLMLTLVADFSDFLRHTHRHEQDTDFRYADAVFYNLVGAVVRNMADQTFLRGLKDVTDFITTPRSKAEKYIGGMTANFFPYAGFWRSVQQDFTDPCMRKAKTLLDYWKYTSGVGRADIPIRYSWITGKPEMRERFPEYHKDPVMSELWELSDKVTGGPTDTLKGVKLDDARMSELYRLHGTVRIGGKTMYERLGELIANPRYQRLPYAPDGVPGPRDRAVNKVIDAYRRMAVRELLKADAPLRGQVLAQNVVKKGARGGAVSRDNATEVREALQNLLGGIRPDGSAAAAASPGPEHDAAMQRMRDLVATRR